jgi:Protein of unknown function (DUF559)
MGVTKGQIEVRRTRGLLHPIHRGVYAVGQPRTSLRGRWLAAVLACGSDALLSHRSAAALHGLLRARSSNPEVTVSDARRRNPRGVHVHRTRHLTEADSATVDAIPTTSIPRTLLDLAETADESTLASAFEEADRLRVLSVADLLALRASSHGRRGLRAFDLALAAHTYPADVQSELERRFHKLCIDEGIPEPALNVLVEGHVVDCLWASHRLVVELDGFRFHRTRAAHERDHSRDAHLALAGYTVRRFTYRQVRDEPAKVIALVRRALAER